MNVVDEQINCMIVDVKEMDSHKYKVNHDKIEYLHNGQYTDKLVKGY